MTITAYFGYLRKFYFDIEFCHSTIELMHYDLIPEVQKRPCSTLVFLKEVTIAHVDSLWTNCYGSLDFQIY